MKESKEKEHRISNLKDMIQNVKEDVNVEDDFEEDSELINYLNEEPEEFEELEINDEFIYRPGDKVETPINLEDNPIDEDFIIKTPSEKEIEEKTENQDFDEFTEDFMGDISENFDNLVNAKIGRTPILGLVSAFLGLILIAISAFIFQSRSDRIIDHVASGETNFIFVIVLLLGLLFLVYGIFKVFHISAPFKNITASIDSIGDDDKKEKKSSAEDQTPQAIPKSKIPLDKESYKIGEFEFEDIKNKLKKPTASKNKIQQPTEENLDDLPPARQKEVASEEIEYVEVVHDGESIDDIFAEVEDIDEIPIISIDSKEKEE